MGIVDGENGRPHAHGRPVAAAAAAAAVPACAPWPPARGGAALAAGRGGAGRQRRPGSRVPSAATPGPCWASPEPPAGASPSPACPDPGRSGRQRVRGQRREAAGGAPLAGASQGVGAAVSQVVQRAVAPVTAVLGATAGSVPGLKTVPALVPLTAVTGTPAASRVAGAGGLSGPGDRRHLLTRPRRRRGRHERSGRYPAGRTQGPFRASRTCPHRPVWPARPPGTGPRAAAIPYPGPHCPRPTRA